MLHVLILLQLTQPAHAQSGVSRATVAAVGSAVAAVVAAGLTGYIFVETRRMRLAQTEPHVGVSVVASEFAFGFADLVVRNDGPGAAIDVRFEPVIDTPGEPDAKLLGALKDLGLVKHGIPYLAPGGEFRTYIAPLIGKHEAALHTYVHLRVKYRSYGHVPYESCYPVELDNSRSACASAIRRSTRLQGTRVAAQRDRHAATRIHRAD